MKKNDRRITETLNLPGSRSGQQQGFKVEYTSLFLYLYLTQTDTHTKVDKSGQKCACVNTILSSTVIPK